MKIQEEGKIVTLSKVTSSDEDKLRDLSLKTKEESPIFNVSNAIETSLETHETHETDSFEIMAQILCSSCKEPIGKIANGWPLSVFKKVKGYYCRNSSCEFYRKFIPVNKSRELVTLAALPVLHATLNNANVPKDNQSL
ncbi:hypothetical protein ACFLWZ_04520 [Chloroflexota bacterium]